MLYHLQVLDLGTILNLVRNLINSLQFVGQYGLLAVFFAHMSPSIFFLMEGIDTAAVILGFNPFAIVLFAVIGGTIGDFIWYYAGFYSYRKLKKVENGKAVSLAKHHRRIAFLYSAFPGGEILMVYAGIKHYKPRDILPFVIASNAIRSGLAVGVVTGIITFLPEIIKLLIF